MELRCYRCSCWPCECADGCTIIHGDCREVLPHITFDCVVTDPPYGVGFGYEDYVDDDAGWSATIGVLRDLVATSPSSVCMSFARLWEMPPAKWAACWFKPGSVRRSKVGGWSTWEPVLLYGSGWKIANDLLRLPDCTNHTPEASSHPCPKPEALFRWILNSRESAMTLDPFMGSGTTLRAAKDIGRNAIGIELSERYCEIAANRLRQQVLNLNG